MSDVARLLFPAVRWSDDDGYGRYRAAIERGSELGVGGWIIFGGPAEKVRELTDDLRARSRHPLLIGADLERGAGQQFRGATALPPPAVLAELDDVELSRRAGELTAREALALGINWVYAPVADLDLEPENPIVGTRAFGADPERAARHVRAWIEGCRSAGALACAKHFPGHGRTTTDSHLALPVVDAAAAELETDLVPFRAAIDAGVDSVMSAHVAFPALDPSGAPATLSKPILTGLLRDRLGFDGLVITDALIMEGITGGGDEPAAAITALEAGCDALLYPRDLEALAARLESAREVRRRADESVARIAGAAARVDDATRKRTADGQWGQADDRRWALELAGRALRPLRGEPRGANPIQLLTIDDDVGGPFAPPPRLRFAEALRENGVVVHEVDRADGALPLVIGLYADIKGFKGRPGVSAPALERIGDAISSPRGAVVVLFGPPRLSGEVPGAHVLGAWGGERLMQEAAARWLGERSSPGGS